MAAVLVGGVGLVGSLPTLTTPVSANEPETSSMSEVDKLPKQQDRFRRSMLLDPKRRLGFTLGFSTSHIKMTDLDRLIELSTLGDLGFDVWTRTVPEKLAVDTKRERIYRFDNRIDMIVGAPPPCSGTAPGQFITAVDYRSIDGQRVLRGGNVGRLACTGQFMFFASGLTYDETHDLVYASGRAYSDEWRAVGSGQVVPLGDLFTGGELREDRGQALLLRQMRPVGEAILAAGQPLTKEDVGKSPAQLVLDWEIDLRAVGCGRRDVHNRNIFETFVARVGDAIYAYCWDARAYRGVPTGAQGYLVRIPLVDDGRGGMRPATVGGAEPQRDPAGPPQSIANYDGRRIPALPGLVTPVVDEASGRILLVTADRVNGNAVWVFDTNKQRFVGVITGGFGDQPQGNTAVGFDPDRGRVYLLTQDGILVASVRPTPLPAGVLVPVVQNQGRGENFASAARIGVVPDRRRLFVPLQSHYAVLEDQITDPPAVKPIDPDSLTTDVDESDKTLVTTNGRGIATGLHVVVAGGLARGVNQLDPSCRFTPPDYAASSQDSGFEPIRPDWELAPALIGTCVAELAIAAGHRESVTAHSDVEVGSESGASARAAIFGTTSTDSGTDGDIRRPGDCAASTPEQVNSWARTWPLPRDEPRGDVSDSPSWRPINGKGRQGDVDSFNEQARDPFWTGSHAPRQAFVEGWNEQCAAFQDETTSHGAPDFRSGARGGDGQGFVIRSAVCGDFGGQPSVTQWPESPPPGSPMSNATCDAGTPHAGAQAESGSLRAPQGPDDASFSVAQVASQVKSIRTDQGQVTVAFAIASGVQIGPLRIGAIRALAVTGARGRPESTSATLVRQWCGISSGTAEEQGCVDASSPEIRAFIEQFNKTMLDKVQLSVPDASATASPGGYQSVVTKDSSQRATDQTVNDDDSHTVSALQVELYNDGGEGRNRLIAQLAGVHAESRYGIVELPVFSGGDAGTPPPSTGGIANPRPEPEPAPPNLPPDTRPEIFTPPSFAEQDVIIEVVRTNAAIPPVAVGRTTPSGGPAERIIRVPVQALKDAIELIVQHPREFGLLFVLLSLLATPLYLGSRRRAFARSLVI